MNTIIDKQKIQQLLELAEKGEVESFYVALWDYAGYGIENPPEEIPNDILNTLRLFQLTDEPIDLGLYRRFHRGNNKCPLPKDKCIIYAADGKWSKFYQSEEDRLMHIDVWDGESWRHNIDQVHFPEIDTDVVRFAYKLIYVIGLGATIEDLDWVPQGKTI